MQKKIKKSFDIHKKNGLNISISLMPRRLTVGHDTLDVGILVRIQARQP